MGKPPKSSHVFLGFSMKFLPSILGYHNLPRTPTWYMPLPRLGACNLRKGKVKARILITGSATQLKWRMKGCKYSCKWHVYIWAIYNDISRGHPKWWFTKGNSLISGKSRLVKYYNLARWDTRTGEIVSIHSTCLGKRFWFPIEIQELMRWSPSQFIVCLLYKYI